MVDTSKMTEKEKNAYYKKLLADCDRVSNLSRKNIETSKKI